MELVSVPAVPLDALMGVTRMAAVIPQFREEADGRGERSWRILGQSNKKTNSCCTVFCAIMI